MRTQFFHVRRLVTRLTPLQTNVLINDEGRACISGFEMAVIRNPLAPDEDDPDAFYAGAIEYMAPELFASKGTASRSMATDIYSLAVIMIWVIFQLSS
jgi:serine/threonine protein kinase